MRLKTVAEDFRVRELLQWPDVPGGRHIVHLLHKEKLSTPEALQVIAQRADVDRASIAYAGLKDRQAITDQYVSIEGRAVELKLPNLRLQPVGATDQPITSKQSRGNAFTIVVRDLQPAKAALLRRSLPSLQKTGLPNYFDDQRFGCLRHGQGFVMLAVLRGDFEQALRGLVAQPSPIAITGDVKLKQLLQTHWGDWETCLRIARGPLYEGLFRHLRANPEDFRGALEFIPVRTRVIHSFAFQSLLWNRAVSRLLRGGVLSSQRLRISTLAGDLIAWKYLEPEREQKLLAMRTPLYGPDGDGGSEPFRKAMAEELRQADIERGDFLRNEVPGMVWREEPREVLVKPQDMAEVKIEPDDMHDGRVKATVAFSLPRGAYATMVLKRLLAPPFYGLDDRDERGHGGRDGALRRPDARDGFRGPGRGPRREPWRREPPSAAAMPTAPEHGPDVAPPAPPAPLSPIDDDDDEGDAS